MREYNIFLQLERSLVQNNLHIFMTSFLPRYSLVLKMKQTFSVMEELTCPPLLSPFLLKCKTCHKLLFSLLCQTRLKLSKCYKKLLVDKLDRYTHIYGEMGLRKPDYKSLLSSQLQIYLVNM